MCFVHLESEMGGLKKVQRGGNQSIPFIVYIQ